MSKRISSSVNRDGKSKRKASTGKKSPGPQKSTRRPAPRKSSTKSSSQSSRHPQTTFSGSSGTTTGSNAAADFASQLAALQDRWDQARGQATLSSVYDQLEDLTTTVTGLDPALEDLRAREYIFGRGWEARVAEIQKQWPAQRRDAVRQLERERRSLNSAVATVADFVSRAARSRDGALVDTADDRVWSFERRVREAEQRVRGSFDQVGASVSALRAEFAQARAVLEAVDAASFSLFPDEHPFAVVEAAWEAKGNEPIEGMLFLTDSRVIFEKRDRVTTKKFLFIPTERKMVQELLWQAPVGGVDVLDVQDEKRFLRRNKELLVLRMDGGEGPPEVVVDLKRGTNETWSQWIRRAREGRLEAERFVATPPAADVTGTRAPASSESDGPESEQPAAQKLPTRCPSCGAALPTIYKGMHQVTCDYCGATVSLP